MTSGTENGEYNRFAIADTDNLYYLKRAGRAVAILEHMVQFGPSSNSRIYKDLAMSAQLYKYHVGVLFNMGLIQKDGSVSDNRWIVTEKGAAVLTAFRNWRGSQGTHSEFDDDTSC